MVTHPISRTILRGRQFISKIRHISPAVTKGVPPRGRLQAQQQQMERERERKIIAEKKEANKIIDAINTGKVKNVSQIPPRFRSMLNVSQSQLNKISDYYVAKKDADLWAGAFALADMVLSSSDPRAIFAISFSENPYAKTAYIQLKANYKAYQQRKKIIEDIRAGKISNVKIEGGRIWDTTTGIPITPIKATRKQIVEMVNKELPEGDRVVYDKNYNILNIDAKTINKIVPYTQRGIDFYNKELQKIVTIDDKVMVDESKIKLLSRQWSEDIKNTKIRLTEANKRGDQNRLRILLTLGNRVTTNQRKERDRLLKETAKNYELEAELIMKILGTTLINMGVGSVELIKALNQDPKATLIALPPAILDGLKNDFNRIMSGDPLEIGSVGLEYYTMGRIFGLLGIAGKTAFKTSISIGRTLSPKYFGEIGIKLLIPPVRLRGVVLPPSRIVKINNLIKVAMAKPGFQKQFDRFIGKLHISKINVNKKLDLIKRRALLVQKRIQRKLEITKKGRELEIKKFKTAEQFKKELIDASKSRKLARKKGRTISIGNRDYVKAIDLLEEFTNKIAKIKAKIFIAKLKNKGERLGLGQEDQFIKAVQTQMKNKLNKMPEFKKLKEAAKLNEPFQIRLIKTKKISSAKKLFNDISSIIKKLKFVKQMNFLIRKIVKRVKRVKKKIKVKKELAIKKIKTKKEFNNQLRRARKFRKLARKKGRTISIGNRDYVKAIDLIEQLANNLAWINAKKLIRQFKGRGGKIGLGQEEQFIKAVQNNAIKNLRKMSDFKKLEKYGKLNEPFQIKLIKAKRIDTAKKLFNDLSLRTKKLKSVKQMNFLIKKIVKRVKRVSGKIRRIRERRIKRTRLKRLKKQKPVKFKLKTIEQSKRELLKAKLKSRKFKKGVREAKRRRRKSRKRIKEEIARRILAKERIKRIELVNPTIIKKINIKQLRDARTIKGMNRFVDRFFNELGRRQKINISAIQFRQFKNVIKKRLRSAIKRGDKDELRKFASSIKKLIDDMNKRANYPNIRVIDKKKRFRTIKDFKPETPKDGYIEVRKGQQILIQKPQVKKVVEQVQVFVIRNVQKKAIDLKPLIKYGIESLSVVAFKNMIRTKQVFATVPSQTQLFGLLQDSAQDFKFIQVVAQKLSPKLKVVQLLRQDFASKLKRKLRLRTKLKLVTKKKKKTVRVRLKKPKNTRKLSKKVMGYAFVIKKKGKEVRLKLPPLTLKDAFDIGSYKLDHDLQRTGRLVPIGMVNVVAKLPKLINGYFAKKKKKFRRFRKKKGKIISLERTIIEKKKYIGDTVSEIRALKKSRIKKRRQPIRVKRKVIKRKPTRVNKQRNLQKLKIQKRALILKRKRIINSLKRKRK